MSTKKYNFEIPTTVPFSEIIEATISDYKAIDSALAVNSIHTYSVYNCGVGASPIMGGCYPAWPACAGSYTVISCASGLNPGCLVAPAIPDPGPGLPSC